MSGFTKLSSDIVTSTIWLEDDSTLRVWIGMLAMAGPDGFVPGSVPGLANIFRVTVDQMRAALTKFEGPDPDSRTKDNDGRRIEAIDGGWILLNHAKHREKKDPEIRKAQVREAVARHRAKKALCNQSVNNVIKVSQSKPKSEVRSQITDKDVGKKVGQLSNDEWIKSLEQDEAYQGLNVREQIAKCKRWCETNKKTLSRRRIVNWLNRAEKPIHTTNGPQTKGTAIP